MVVWKMMATGYDKAVWVDAEDILKLDYDDSYTTL